jgi:hypothetical protein
MNSIEPSVGAFSKEEIHQQLQRIKSDRIFAFSDILQKFLLFIANETLEGRGNQLKEYTIGLNVLQKPFNFDPRHDAIVRIHACRLRRALHNYYKLSGTNDPIHISIPKGRYLPVFSDNRLKSEGETVTPCEEESMNISIAGDPGKNVVRVDMQYCEDRINITVCMTNIETHEEIWKQVIEYKISNSGGLDIQEDIARKLILVIGDYYNFIKHHVTLPPAMAVA